MNNPVSLVAALALLVYSATPSQAFKALAESASCRATSGLLFEVRALASATFEVVEGKFAFADPERWILSTIDAAPSHDASTPIVDEAVALTIKTRPVLITPFSVARRMRSSSANLYERTFRTQPKNLERLDDARADRVVGSDKVRGVSIKQARHREAPGRFRNHAVLSMSAEGRRLHQIQSPRNDNA